MTKTKNTIYLAAIVAFAFSCASAPVKSVLKDSSPSPKPSFGVFVYRIRARTRNLALKNVPYLVLDKLSGDSDRESKVKKGFSKDSWENIPLPGSWIDAEGGIYYESLFVARAEPGDYHLKKLYQLLSVDKSVTYAYPYTTTTTTTKWLDEILQSGVRIEAGQMLYLGIIQMDLEVTKESSYSYHYTFLNQDSALAQDEAAVREKLPGLYAAFGSKIAPARIFSYQDLNLSTTNYSTHKGYVKKTKSDDSIEAESTVWTINAMGGSPYAVEWRSFWKEGSPEQPYGIYFGPDPKNVWLFGITEKGRAQVQVLSNGNLGAPILDVPAAVRPGMKKISNRCRVEIREGQAFFYVNGVLAGNCNCPQELSGGITGIFALGQGIFDIQKVTARELIE